MIRRFPKGYRVGLSQPPAGQGVVNESVKEVSSAVPRSFNWWENRSQVSRSSMPVSGKAIASLVLGIVSLICVGLMTSFVLLLFASGWLLLVGELTGLIGVVLGHVSLSRITQSQGRMLGRGLAVAGLVTNYATVCVSAVLIIHFVFILPVQVEQMEVELEREVARVEAKPSADLQRTLNEIIPTQSVKATAPAKKGPPPAVSGALPPEVQTAMRRSAQEQVARQIEENEERVVNALRDIVSAQTAYRATNGRYTGRLKSLKGDLDEDRLGYQFRLMVVSDSYRIYASPTVPGVTGQRYFYADESGIIRANEDGKAGANCPAVSGAEF